jgi:hypothetical protein
MDRATTTRLDLDVRPGVRAGWGALGLTLNALGAAALLGMFSATRHPFLALGLVLVIAAFLGWLGDGALRLARRPPGSVTVGDDEIVVRDDALLAAPIVITRSDLVSVEVDDRPDAERWIASELRHGGVVEPSFVDITIPVLSRSPSAHGRYGSRAAPNLVLRFAPIDVPAVPRGVRAALTLGQGRNGRYRGPKPGHELRALRMEVGEGATAAAVFGYLGVLDAQPRDARYLRGVSRRDRERFRVRRRAMALVVVGTVALLLAARLLG